jgi:hypothetical protein
MQYSQQEYLGYHSRELNLRLMPDMNPTHPGIGPTKPYSWRIFRCQFSPIFLQTGRLKMLSKIDRILQRLLRVEIFIGFVTGLCYA